MALGADTTASSETPSRLPTKAELMRMTAPDYRPAAGAIGECIGRLAFETPRAFEWPTATPFELQGPFNHAFSASVFDPGDVIEVDGVSIGVVHPMSREDKAAILESLPGNELIRLKSELKEAEVELRKLRGAGDKSPRGQESVRIEEFRVTDLKRRISESNFEGVSLGVPDGVAYQTTLMHGHVRYVVLRAYLFRGTEAFAFESRADAADQAAVKQQRATFMRLIAVFKPREFGQVPKDLGICIPYGFIPDDGKTSVKVKQSIRFADAPNVLYTLNTGSVHARTLKSTVINAIASAKAGLPGFSDEAGIGPLVTQRIGPRSVKMGGVNGEQGGIVLKVSPPGKAAFEAYSVSTGFAGWLGTMAMPYMLVDLRTFTKDQAPELKANPPPFKQSKERLDYILTGLRLRATSPSMPELR